MLWELEQGIVPMHEIAEWGEAVFAAPATEPDFARCENVVGL
jgi:hypothetical protein